MKNPRPTIARLLKSLQLAGFTLCDVGSIPLSGTERDRRQQAKAIICAEGYSQLIVENSEAVRKWITLDIRRAPDQIIKKFAADTALEAVIEDFKSQYQKQHETRPHSTTCVLDKEPLSPQALCPDYHSPVAYKDSRTSSPAPDHPPVLNLPQVSRRNIETVSGLLQACRAVGATYRGARIEFADGHTIATPLFRPDSTVRDIKIYLLCEHLNFIKNSLD